MAALTVLTHSETTELSLQQHLDLTPDLVAYNTPVATEADSEPLMMAQQVSHQATDKRRVKVYELRENDWFDRGTGFCSASITTVYPPPPLSFPSRCASLVFNRLVQPDCMTWLTLFRRTER